MNTFDSLPDNALVRIDSIVKNPKKGTNGLFPISRSAWYAGIKKGIYPQPVKISGGRATAWRVGDIRKLLESQNQSA